MTGVSSVAKVIVKVMWGSEVWKWAGREEAEAGGEDEAALSLFRCLRRFDDKKADNDYCSYERAESRQKLILYKSEEMTIDLLTRWVMWPCLHKVYVKTIRHEDAKKQYT